MRIKRFVGMSLLAATFLATAAVAGAWWWLDRPLAIRDAPVELDIEPGTSPRAVAALAVGAGVDTDARWLWTWFRLSGQARQIKAGSYELPAGTTPRSLLGTLTRGDATQTTVTLVEGWNLRQIRQALAKVDGLKLEAQELDDEQLMRAVGGNPALPAEGQFFPETYAFAKGSSDVAVLRRAYRAMQKQLVAAWAQRDTNSVLRNPQEALILASIVEKETGAAQDRAQISGVFHNRLRIDMPLQTDPTVIYGLGERFDGNLRRVDLRTDTPYNTYTRRGLPPGPIASPGKASLLAAVRPAATPALYFVARGDGSSEFSRTLAEHNRAVDRYQRGQANK
jgi:UPF0755 protein